MKKFFIALLTITACYSCATVPLTGRRQLALVDDSQINQAAAQSYNQLLSDPKTTVITNGTNVQRVKRVGTQLATVIESYLKANGYGNQYNFQWEFNLIQSNEINAWCMPGGKVAVYSGLMPLAPSDADLATVMGHEIGHAIARHSAERISRQLVVQGAGGVVGAATGGQTQATQTVINSLYGVGGELVLLNYSRQQESEADRLGLTFMAMAGYDPHLAVIFWNRMAAQNKGGSPPVLLSTHPADAQRIADIQNHIPEAMKYYKH
jgi:predicted Zn-dependent protease